MVNKDELLDTLGFLNKDSGGRGRRIISDLIKYSVDKLLEQEVIEEDDVLDIYALLDILLTLSKSKTKSFHVKIKDVEDETSTAAEDMASIRNRLEPPSEKVVNRILGLRGNSNTRDESETFISSNKLSLSQANELLKLVYPEYRDKPLPPEINSNYCKVTDVQVNAYASLSDPRAE